MVARYSHAQNSKMRSTHRKFSSSAYRSFRAILFALLLTTSVAQRQPERQQQAAVAAAPSGEAMPVGDIAGWHQVFTDDFTKTVAIGRFPGAVSNKWFAYPDGWKDDSKKGTYFPSKVVSEHGGVLDLFLHTENGVHMVSAPVPKLAAGSHHYGSGLSAGRYVVRFKADPIPCYKTAWLLWPDSGVWPRDGEIDFPEGPLDGSISGYMHRQNGTSRNAQDVYNTAVTYSSWHTAVIEWRPAIHDLKFYLDGKRVGHSTSRVPNTPMHWVLQTETRLAGCVPTKRVAGHVLIDWVAVYVPSAHTASARICSLLRCGAEKALAIIEQDVNRAHVAGLSGT
jgi:hypothetical protein